MDHKDVKLHSRSGIKRSRSLDRQSKKAKNTSFTGRSSSTDASSCDSTERSHRKKSKHKKKKSEKREKKKHRKHKKKKSKHKGVENSPSQETPNEKIEDTEIGPLPPGLSKQIKPMTKEEWEKQQSVVRRVYDPETGRNRLVKGDGEILEEIVSRERHKEINKAATLQDGESFKKHLGLH